MGDINEGMVLGCLSTVELALVELGIPHGKNAVRAAVEFLARERASGGKAEEQRAAA
jgi:alanine-glyoxylate transaminase/serine-glyoxylate transaminase/serine-pyruvate transaminase